MNTPPSANRSPLAFFVLTLALASPFLVLGTAVGGPRGIPMDLPWSAVVFVTPAVAAAILVHRQAGADGVRDLLKRVFDHRRIRRRAWYLPVILLMPAIVALSTWVMSLLGLEAKGSYSSLMAIPVLFVVFFIGAVGEELGWTGYAIDPLQARWGALPAAALLGSVWVIIHLIPWLQIHGPMWTLGYSVYTLAVRVIMVWLYNSTGKSLLSAVLFHDMINTSGSVSPYTGSPLMPYILATLTAITAAIVVFLWGPRTLARYRYSRDAGATKATA